MLYDRIALARHDSTAAKAERLQNAKNWFLRLNNDASKVSYALKQCLAQQSLRPISPEHPQRQRQDQQEKTSITMSIGKQDGGATESHGATRRQRLHLINGGDFGFLEGIPESRRRGVDRTLTHKTHLCSTVPSQRAPHKTKRDLHSIFVQQKECCHLVCHMSHPCLLSHAPS